MHISYAEVATEKEQYETITVNHFTDITLPPHAVQLSDPITQKVRAGEWIRIKMRFCGGISETACTFFDNSVCRVAHSSEPGEKSSLQTGFAQKEPAHRCVVCVDRVFVLTDANVHTVAAFGDSITHMSRWTAPLTERLYRAFPNRAALINCGICGNRILHDASQGSGHGGWFGNAGVERFERDLFYNGFEANTVLLLEGINDILHPSIGEAPTCEAVTPEQIVGALEAMTKIAHNHNARIFSCTVMPFNGCKKHWKPELEQKRCEVNGMLRQSAKFDGLLDFDLWTRDANDPTRLDPSGQSEDHLHPGVTGGIKMAEKINLNELLV